MQIERSLGNVDASSEWRKAQSNLYTSSQYTQQYIKYRLSPSSDINSSDPAQTVKFNLTTQMLIDPKTTYLEVVLSLNANDYAKFANTLGRICDCEGLALDGPATALIQALKIYSNGRLVENVNQYNDIGQVIRDLNFNSHRLRNHKEFGYDYMGNRAVDHGQNGMQTTNRNSELGAGGINWNTSTAPVFLQINPGSGYMPSFFPLLKQSYQNNGQLSSITALTTHASIIASPYITSSVTNSFTGYTQLITPGGNIQNGVYTQFGGGGIGLKSHAGFNRNLFAGLYGIQPVDALYYDYYNQCFCLPHHTGIPGHSTTSNSGVGQNTQNQAGLNGAGQAYRRRACFDTLGLQQPNCPELHNENNDMLLLPGHATIQMSQGRFAGIYRATPGGAVADPYTTLATYTSGGGNLWYTFQNAVPALCQTEFKFKIPILSNFFGLLTPRNVGLIDGSLLGALQFEWTFNPYAFYTTGAKPSVSGKTTPPVVATDLFARKYTFQSVTMVIDMYHPINVSAKAVAPPSFFSKQWGVVLQKTVNGTNNLQGEHGVNRAVRSARLMVTRFLLQDYLTHSYCRQQYKISGNITSYQVQLGQLNFPMTPVKGHAGNPAKGSYTNTSVVTNAVVNPDLTVSGQIAPLNVTADNSEFVELFNRELDLFMEFERSSPLFTNLNFAPNKRIWNPAENTIGLGYDKLDGNPYIFEQFQGKAMYITRLDGVTRFSPDFLDANEDSDFITTDNSQAMFGWGGLDTTNMRPFVIELESEQGTNLFNPSKITMQTLMLYDVQVLLSSDGVYVLGGLL